jgi:hypothetical protein
VSNFLPRFAGCLVWDVALTWEQLMVPTLTVVVISEGRETGWLGLGWPLL